MNVPRFLLVWNVMALIAIAAAAFVPQKSMERRTRMNPPAAYSYIISPQSQRSFTIAAAAASASNSASMGAMSSQNPEEILSEESRANLFQFLLRDLQVEGVPLLSVDADQVHTLQAAIWTTMAELLTSTSSKQHKHEEKACLIFEDIPMDALRSFVDDFRILQTQERLMQQLPELARLHLSLVGKGVGPAILVAASTTGKSASETDAFTTEPTSVDEFKVTAGMKMFVDRVVSEAEVGFQPSRAAYRVCCFADICHVLSSFWNCICELQATPADQISTFVLMMPHATDVTTTVAGSQSQGMEQRHARFAAVAELLSRSLCLYRGDDVFELLHFHPTYERDLIYPVDRPAHGHLPPSNWIRPVLKHYYETNGSTEAEAPTWSEEDLQLVNYQRRAPVTAVGITRVSLIDAATKGGDDDAGTTELDIGDGMKASASGISYFARSIQRMVQAGKETLQSKLESELSVVEQT
jgi:hypothetical protein